LQEVTAPSVANRCSWLYPRRKPLANRRGLAHLLRARVHCQWEIFMKGQEKKKEDKKKPQKTLKEKRAEKHAKKDSKG
jgi:hypothetical protein